MAKYYLGLLHRYLGLLSGVIIFTVCITGSMYAFKKEFVESKQSLESVSEYYHALPLSDIYAKVNLESNLRVSRIYEYDSPKRLIKIIAKDAKDKYYLFVNPYTGAIVDQFRYKDSFWGTVLGIHRHLLLPKYIGNKIIGYSVIIFVLMLLSGLVLWFPRNLKSKELIRFKLSIFSKPRVFCLHSNLAVYVLVPLLISSLTGLIWTFPTYEKAVYRVFDSSYKRDNKNVNENVYAFHPSSLDQIHDYVNENNDERIGVNIYFIPKSEKKLLRVLSSVDEDQFGYSHNYYANPETGDVIRVDLDKDKSLGTKLRSLNYDIHTGSLFGLWSKFFVFFLGIIGASIPLTGYLLYFKKR